MEQDEQKNAYIIDFKTSKYTLTKAQAVEDPQLGVYRLAVAKNSLQEENLKDLKDTGASLVYLKHMQKDGLKEMPTESIEVNGILNLLKESYEKIKEEDFSANPSPLCRTCQFIRMCPAHPEGKSIVQ